jgi:hypothetical protein
MNASSAFFNLGQSRSIRETSRLHPHVTIMLIADDTHVLGHPEEVIVAIKSIRTLYSRIGLTQLRYLPSTAGLEVGGTPVGHYDFVTESANKCVDKICYLH